MGCEFCDFTDKDVEDLLFETKHWKIFLSKEQAYLGRSVVVLNRHCSHLSLLTKVEWEELQKIIKKIETNYKKYLGATHFNWTCLMNDAYKNENPEPHVHLHVRPRYAFPPKIEDNEYPDPNFGHHYLSKSTETLPDNDREKIVYRLREAFKREVENV